MDVITSTSEGEGERDEVSKTAADNYWQVCTPDPSPQRPLSSNNQRSLFGGAIVVYLPAHFKDVSEVRQIPDNQEVFMDMNSSSTITVEILQYQEDVRNEVASVYFFDDLGETNQATKKNVLSQGIIKSATFMPMVRETFPKCVLIGEQRCVQANPGSSGCLLSLCSLPLYILLFSLTITFLILKATPKNSDLVYIMLALVRLKMVDSEILITLSTNNLLSQPGDVKLFLSQDSHVFNIADEYSPEDALRALLHSFDIKDWSLFA